MRKIICLVLIFILAALNVSAAEDIEKEILKEWRAITSPKPLLAPGKTQITPSTPYHMTSFLLKVKKNWNELSPSTQDLLYPILLRPTDPSYYVRHNGQSINTAYSSAAVFFSTPHFKIWYMTEGADAVPLIITNPNLVPDFVDAVAAAFESSYAVGVTNKGYKNPPSDQSAANNGGDEKYDVYLIDIGTDFPGLFAWTDPEGKPNSNNDVYYSFIVMDNDYSTTQYDTSKTPENLARVTAAHEYFHAVQFGYNVNVENWFMEASAVCFEDIVFPNINDYIRYLKFSYGWFASPELPLDYDTTNSTHKYGSGIFPIFLEKNYTGILKDFWNDASLTTNPNTFNILDSRLKNKGTSLYSAFGKFTVWNYIVGNRNDGLHYDDASLYPDTTLYIYDTVQAYMTTTVTASKAKLPCYLGSNYIMFTPAGGGTSARIAFDGAESSSKTLLWNASILTKYGTTWTDTTITLNAKNTGGINLSTSFDTIILIPSLYETTHSQSDITSFGYIYGFSNDTTAPAPVSSLTAIDRPSDQGFIITLTWAASPSDTTGGDIESYDILRSTASGGNFEMIGSVAPTASTTYVNDSNVGVNKTNFYFKIRPRDKWFNYDTAGEVEAGPVAAIDNTAPAPPTDVKAVDTPKDEGTSIDVTWTLSTDDGTGANDVSRYTIFHSMNRTGTFQSAGSVSSNVKIFHDTSVVQGIDYYFYVRAEDGNPNYSYSTAYYFYNTTATDTTHDVYARALDDFVPAPTDFKAAGTPNHIALSWKNPTVTDLSKIIIKRKTDTYPINKDDGNTIYQGTDSTISDSDNLSEGQTYYYSAISNDTTGNYSEIDSGSKAKAIITLQAFNYPNPTFTGETYIRYQLEDTSSDVVIYIFDISGELVLKVSDALNNSNNTRVIPNAPVYDYHWNGKNGRGNPVASGIYIFMIKANDSISKSNRTGKIAVIR